MARLRMIAVLALAALFAMAAAQDNELVAPASDAEGQGKPTGWLDYIFQFTVAGDDGTLSTWNVEVELPMDMPSPPPDAWTQSEMEQEEAGDDLAMATPEAEEDATTDEDDAPNCGMFLQTAFDVCAEQRCDFSCHHHHHHHDHDHDHDHEEDQEGEAEEDVVPEAYEERTEDDHDHKFRHQGGHHHHHHRRGPRIARQCRDAVKDARDKMDQCGAQTFQSSEDPGFVFAYSDALNALEEANEGMCACGFFCSHPTLTLGLSAFLIFTMWAIVYTKLYRCVVARNRQRLGAVKARFLAVLLVPGALVVLMGLCVIMSYVVAFPMISIPLLLALFFGLSARRMRLRRLRMRQQQLQQQRLPQAATINLPTVRSVPADGRAATMPTATLVAFPAGRPVKGDVVVSAIVV